MSDCDFVLVEDDRPQGALIRKGKHAALRENMELAEGLERLHIEVAASDSHHLLSLNAQHAITSTLLALQNMEHNLLLAELDESKAAAGGLKAELNASNAAAVFE